MPRTSFALSAADLPQRVADNRHPLFWGFLSMIAIEATVFATLVVSFFYLRMSADAWPPEPYPMPELLVPSLNTLVLISSSGAMIWADRGIKKDDARQLAWGLTIGILLALIFLTLKAYEYLVEVGYQWDQHAYASIVWTIVGFHTAHVIALVLKTIVVATLAWRDYFSQERRVGVTVNGIYWHFVVIVWIPLYVVLYWSPRFL